MADEVKEAPPTAQMLQQQQPQPQDAVAAQKQSTAEPTGSMAQATGADVGAAGQNYVEDLLQDRTYLKCEFLRATALVNELVDSRITGEVSQLRLHVLFQKQRYISAAVPASAEPVLNASCLFELLDFPVTSIADARRALRNTSAVHVCLVKIAQQEPAGKAEIVGAAIIDWRYAALFDGEFISVELLPCDHSSIIGAACGVMYVRLQLLHASKQAFQSCCELVPTLIQQHQEDLAESSRAFYLSAKDWWDRVRHSYPAVQERAVKVFAEDELRQHRCVCSFVSRIRPCRTLDSPRHAARFVSLIPFEREISVGGGRIEYWHSMHSFLAKRVGDCEDHAVLLCSLLLGFGLDAYVAMGTVKDAKSNQVKPHAWVVTLERDDAGVKITCWESLTGQRYAIKRMTDHESRRQHGAGAHRKQHTGATASTRHSQHHFRTVSCLFNDQEFYVNKQQDDFLNFTNFEVHNPDLWEALPADQLNGMQHPFASLELIEADADILRLAEDLEAALKRLIERRRAQGGVHTFWDEDLAVIAQPALASYELDRVIGVTFGNEEFQAGVKRLVPRGHSFKGYPTCFNTTNPDAILATLLKSPAAVDIVDCKGIATRHALRIKICPYPEGVRAVWLMLAVHYKPHPQPLPQR